MQVAVPAFVPLASSMVRSRAGVDASAAFPHNNVVTANNHNVRLPLLEP